MVYTESSPDIMLRAATADDMRACGSSIAKIMHSGDIIVLSGPLGAGKTTFSQGIGMGLDAEGAVVSPTFTIAREIDGHYSDGSPAHLIHVDAYRLPGSDNDRSLQSQDPYNAKNRLLDELESLGLDEELEDPRPGTCILIEWGSAMASVLSDSRLEISITRPVTSARTSDGFLSDGGERAVTLHPVGAAWDNRLGSLQQSLGAGSDKR